MDTDLLSGAAIRIDLLPYRYGPADISYPTDMDRPIAAYRQTIEEIIRNYRLRGAELPGMGCFDAQNWAGSWYDDAVDGRNWCGSWYEDAAMESFSVEHQLEHVLPSQVPG